MEFGTRNWLEVSTILFLGAGVSWIICVNNQSEEDHHPGTIHFVFKGEGPSITRSCNSYINSVIKNFQVKIIHEIDR